MFDSRYWVIHSSHALRYYPALDKIMDTPYVVLILLFLIKSQTSATKNVIVQCSVTLTPQNFILPVLT